MLVSSLKIKKKKRNMRHGFIFPLIRKVIKKEKRKEK